MQSGSTPLLYRIAPQLARLGHVDAAGILGEQLLIQRLALRPVLHVPFRHFARHPGGRKILEAIEQALGLTPHNNRLAYQVLRDYGNMSSATVLFVLRELLATLTPADAGAKVLSCAFGPGLTLEAMLLEVGG